MNKRELEQAIRSALRNAAIEPSRKIDAGWGSSRHANAYVRGGYRLRPRKGQRAFWLTHDSEWHTRRTERVNKEVARYREIIEGAGLVIAEDRMSSIGERWLSIVPSGSQSRSRASGGQE